MKKHFLRAPDLQVSFGGLGLLFVSFVSFQISGFYALRCSHPVVNHHHHLSCHTKYMEIVLGSFISLWSLWPGWSIQELQLRILFSFFPTWRLLELDISQAWNGWAILHLTLDNWKRVAFDYLVISGLLSSLASSLVLNLGWMRMTLCCCFSYHYGGLRDCGFSWDCMLVSIGFREVGFC